MKNIFMRTGVFVKSVLDKKSGKVETTLKVIGNPQVADIMVENLIKNLQGSLAELKERKAACAEAAPAKPEAANAK